jgi:hypothetical protein
MNIESVLNYFLQRDIVFSVDNKIIKEGKLILLSQNEYYINFYLKGASGETKLYEIPYPFDVELMDNYALLYYDIESITQGDDDLYFRLLSLNRKPNNKLYNSIMMIHEKGGLDLVPLDSPKENA